MLPCPEELLADTDNFPLPGLIPSRFRSGALVPLSPPYCKVRVPVLGMPLGRHALSVECLKPWTVAAEHWIVGDPWTPSASPFRRPRGSLSSGFIALAGFPVLGMPLGRHALSVECLKPWTVAAEHRIVGDPWTPKCFPLPTTAWVFVFRVYRTSPVSECSLHPYDSGGSNSPSSDRSGETPLGLWTMTT